MTRASSRLRLGGVEHVAHADEDALARERLLEEVARAELDGLHGVVDRRVPADDDDGQVARWPRRCGSSRGRRGRSCRAASRRGWRGRRASRGSRGCQRLRRRLGAEDAVALALEHELQRAADVLLVVDDEHRPRGRGARRRRARARGRGAARCGPPSRRGSDALRFAQRSCEVVARLDGEGALAVRARRWPGTPARASPHLCILRYVCPSSRSASASRSAPSACRRVAAPRGCRSCAGRTGCGRRRPRSCPSPGRSARRRARGARAAPSPARASSRMCGDSLASG